jgi:hypothetical protein
MLYFCLVIIAEAQKLTKVYAVPNRCRLVLQGLMTVNHLNSYSSSTE